MDEHRWRQKIEEYQKKWKLLGEKLSGLERARILETKHEELFRLGKQIAAIQVERQQVEEELNALEIKSVDKKDEVTPIMIGTDEKQIYSFLPGRLANKLYGRDKEFLFLDNFLSEYVQICFVYGLGGTGKTALILDFANRLLEKQDTRAKLIIFVSARPKLIEGDFIPEEFVVKNREQLYRYLAEAIGKRYLTRLSLNEQHIEINKELENVGPTLIIVDNWETVEDAKMLGSLENFNNNVKIIITSRILPNTLYSSLLISPLKKDTAVDFVRDSLSRKLSQELTIDKIALITDRLVDLCKGIPLAMQIAFPYIKDLESIEDLREEFVGSQSEGEKHANLCITISEISCKRLKRDYPPLYNVLEILALLPSHLVKEDLKGIVQYLTNRRFNLLALHRYQLTEKDPILGYSLHSFVREYIRNDLLNNQGVYDKVMGSIISYFIELLKELVGNPRNSQKKYRDYKALELRADNIFFLVRWCYQYHQYDSLLALIDNMGYFFRVSEYWNEGEELWNLATKAARIFSDVTHQENSFRFSMYVVYLKLFRGDYHRINNQDIINLFESFFARLSSTQTSHLSEYNNASFLRLIGLYNKEKANLNVSYRFLLQSMRIMDKINNSHGICRVKNDLADLLLSCDPSRAYELLEQSLNLSKKCEDFIEEIRAKRLLGDYFRENADYERAILYYQQALEESDIWGLPDERFCALYGLSVLSTQQDLPDISNDISQEFANLKRWLDNRPVKLSSHIMRCIIFDWSGVLANDLPIVEKCQIQLFKEFASIDLSPEEWRKRASMNWKELLKAIIIDDKKYQIAIEKYFSIIPEHLKEVELLPHAKNVIDILKKEGFIIVIYSGQLPSLVTQPLVAAGIDKWVDIVMTSEELKSPKPDKAHFERIRDQFKLNYTEMIVVDDMTPTLEVAKELGICTVGCKSILDHDLTFADYQIDEIGELLLIISELEGV